MNSVKYYKIYIKIRNQTQELPNIKTLDPSPILPSYELQFVTANEEIWEGEILFKVLGAQIVGDSIQINRVSINESVLPLDLIIAFFKVS